jgi:hypothetical protein
MLNLRIRIIRLQLLIIAIVLSSVTGSSQSSDEMKNIFTQAESYYIYEEYELANQLYLLIETPDNLNIKYKIGTCYLNIPGEKEKSMSYLEDAVRGASYDSKTESFKEKSAPLDAYFNLAKAYMINNEFEKAINTLNTFTRLTKETGTINEIENFEFIDQQIQACKNAIQFRKVPVNFNKVILGGDFGLGSINDNPAVSYDGTTMVYTERRGIENAIFFSKKEGGKWQSPVEITAVLQAGNDCSTCSLNNDGTELFLYKTDNYDGAIYSSKFVNNTWSPIQRLNKNINSKFYESHASVSADGKRLFFTSNRDGGLGNLDLYVSELQESGEWGPAKNLGPEINTPFNEDTPFITQNDSLLFFSSEGHNSMGGYDNYKSARIGDKWNTPSNLGFPLNSADEDKFFLPFNNGKNAYCSMTTGYKEKDIFYLDLEGRNTDLLYSIIGKIVLNDTIGVPLNSGSISIIDKVSGDTLYKNIPDPATGSYNINVAPGLFKILYSCNGYIPQSVDTMIVNDSKDLIVSIDARLIRDSSAIPLPAPVAYEKIDLSNIPQVSAIDSSILIENVNVNDINDTKIVDSEILYYTVQVIALHNPVDVTYFKSITDMKVMYNDIDKFYRYTTGKFNSKEDAYALRSDLIKRGYPKQIFVKKVSKQEKVS